MECRFGNVKGNPTAMSKIVGVYGREILDSRGNPTVEAVVELDCGITGRAAVPSGASTGAHEAVELRDGDKNRYGGKGVLKAVRAMREEIAEALIGMDVTAQVLIDQAMCDLDGTENKSRLGANSTLGVSLAAAKAAASVSSLPLYRYVGGSCAKTLPVPMINVINGGKHADNPIDIQEFMIAPVSAGCFREAARMGSEVFHALKGELSKEMHSTNVGDEGGFAPDIASADEALDFLLRAVRSTGLSPGTDILFALDCASTEYFSKSGYNFTGEGTVRTSVENVEYLVSLVGNYPIYSIEDGCAEDDWDGWAYLTERLGESVQLVGDDLFVTNLGRLADGIRRKCGNSLLVKVNQIGTLSETWDAVDLAHRSGLTTVMSHRSGETEDTTIADLAVAMNCGQIKTGSMSRSDRTAKYNQLIRIEEDLASSAHYGGSRLAAR